MVSATSSERSSAVSSDAAREITGERTFDAPRDLVFKMWTDPKHLPNWWGPNGFLITTYEIDVRPGGSWRFVMHGPDGTDYVNHIVYREVVAPERIAYSHVSGPNFDAVVTFEEQGQRTRVQLRMTFESLELRERVVAEFGAVEGLKQTLGRLAEELSDDTAEETFVISRTFDAPREVMFRVWTDNEHLRNWFGPKETTIVQSTNDSRPDGIYHYAMRTPDGRTMWGRWVYREIVPPQRLVFINSFSDEKAGLTRPPFSERWPSEMLTTITFAERQGKTTVTVRSKPINANAEERKTFAASHASMNGGWSGTFEKLAAYLPEVSK
jgi:uncharacterized protein YndB with AHSA1/START domain